MYNQALGVFLIAIIGVVVGYFIIKEELNVSITKITKRKRK